MNHLNVSMEDSMDFEPSSCSSGDPPDGLFLGHNLEIVDHSRADLNDNASIDFSFLKYSRCVSKEDERNGPGTVDENVIQEPKNATQQPPHLEVPDLHSTSKKSTQRVLSESIVATDATPIRIRPRGPPGTSRKGKLTPASAKRRNKTPTHHVTRTRSPLHGSVSKANRVPSSGVLSSHRTLSIPTKSILKEPSDTEGHSSVVLHKKCANAQESAWPFFDTTVDITTCTGDKSKEVNVATPFHFSTFPASLPRIHNVPGRNLPSSPVFSMEETCDSNKIESLFCPLSVRKRMPFTDNCSSDQSSQPVSSHVTNIIHGFESTTGDVGSIGHLRLPPLPPPSGIETEIQHSDIGLYEMSTPVPHMSIAAGNLYQHATIYTNGSCEGEQANDFASSVSAEHVNDDKMHPPLSTSTVLGITPSRGFSAEMLPSSSSRPQTPREIKLHFQFDSNQCSPIAAIPEEVSDFSSTKRDRRKHSFLNHHESDRLSTSRESLMSSSTDWSSSVSRRPQMARPMPDMTAFEGDGSCSSRDRSFDDSSKYGGSCNQASPPRLLCPPTPVRTPAWAHVEASDRLSEHVLKSGGIKRYGRSNSLIATKVLATCSSQEMNGRACLEYSLDDITRKSHASQKCIHPDDIVTVEDKAVIFQQISGFRGDPQNYTLCNEKDVRQLSPHIPTIKRKSSVCDAGSLVSMETHFNIQSTLGRGAFADVYKVRAKVNGHLYAVKRSRRQFRGTRDREKALAEVKCMQLLQSVCPKRERRETLSFSLYILFFYQAWQEDGHFFCQTELCCRDTCREVHESLRSNWNTSKSRYPSLSKLPKATNISSFEGRLFPDLSLWKLCHDVVAGLCHIHAHGLVHFDIKPSNLFFVPHTQLGVMVKIGDFGMTGKIGSSEDGQEGDQKYMAPELLSSDRKHPSADIFSLGLTLYELASTLSFVLPSEGTRWHELRSGQRLSADLPLDRDLDLIVLIHSMLVPATDKRATAEELLELPRVQNAGKCCDEFLRDYLLDLEEFDRREELQCGLFFREDLTPRHSGRSNVCSPSLNVSPETN